VLVGIKNKYKYTTGNYSTDQTPIDQNLIDQFVEEKDLIIGYCEVDVHNEENNNLNNNMAYYLQGYLQKK
jgi:hypothetical protein